MRAREKMPLFVRAAIDRIVEKIGPHPQVVEQGVTLRGSSVADEAFAPLFRLEEKFQAPAFGRFHFLSKGQIRVHTLQSRGLFTHQKIGNPLGNRV